MAAFFFDHALLPGGWTRDVRVEVAKGAISAVLPGGKPDDAEHIAGFAIPGLPNLHSHAFQRGMAGLAERRGPQSDSFWTWRNIMYRFLEQLTPEDVEAIAAFAYMEMLERGFTSVAEFHYLHHAPDGSPYPDRAELARRVLAGAQTSGIGLTLLPVLYCASGFGGLPPTPAQRRFVNRPDDYVRLAEQCRELALAAGHGFGIAPHSLRAAPPDALKLALAAFPDAPVHIHIAEQQQEVAQCLAWSGLRPVAWLAEHFKPDARWCLVHATHVDDAELRLIADSGALAGLCPITEANLGDGIFPAHEFAALNGRFGVGSDSHVEIDAAGELRLLEYGQRLKSLGRNLLARGEGTSTGAALYEGALAGGAQALGRRCGAIAPDHLADIVVLNAANADIATVKEADRLDAYIFAAGGRAVDRVIVAGSVVVEDGRHRKREAIVRTYAKHIARLRAA